MIDKVKNGVRKTLSSNPKSNISRIKNEQKTHTRKKFKKYKNYIHSCFSYKEANLYIVMNVIIY